MARVDGRKHNPGNRRKRKLSPDEQIRFKEEEASFKEKKLERIQATSQFCRKVRKILRLGERGHTFWAWLKITINQSGLTRREIQQCPVGPALEKRGLLR